MKKLLLVLFLLLTACESTVFGVPKSTWDTLTPAQKQQVIDGYNQRQMLKQQIEPIENAISTAGTLIKQSNS